MLFISCTSTYKYDFNNPSNEILEKNKEIAVSVSEDGFYGSDIYNGSGRTLSNTIRQQLKKYSSNIVITKDKETLKEKATELAEGKCEDLAGSTTSGNTTTTVSIDRKATTCKDSYRVKYHVCDCASQPYEVKNVREARYRTKGDSGNDIAVYCINPADEPPGRTQVKGFDATQCESSNSTPECGFSNILIEGYYRRNIKNNDF